MAGAKPTVHVLQLKPIQIPQSLIKGNKFIKWDDDSALGVPVTLRVDPKGYILYWRDQHKDMDCLDISLISDTRTGRNARVPRDQKLRDSCTMGASDVPLEDKIISIGYGTDMVNVSWINFSANAKDVAQEWADQLLHYATNLLALNQPPMAFLEKCWTKLSLVVGPDGKIPVKNILKMFAQHKDDKKRVEKALEASNLPYGKNDQINPSKFTFAEFLNFYRHLVGRQEVENIFRELGAKKKPYLSVEQFVEFLNNEQRDPRLNEILYPYYDVKRAQGIIDQFEPNETLTSKGHLSLEGFLHFLLSEENALIAPDTYDLSQDMDQPLSHYFINSSHNTYLTGHQLTGKSSIEMYRQALLTGCRCVELDCWDGKGADEEPIITHGFTMCTEVSFKEVIEAISETAFKVSDYPVILSFENHCSPKQQAKMAQHCRNILGDMLLIEPFESNPLEAGVLLPSPCQMKRKIIIKNKKRHMHKSKSGPKKVLETRTSSRSGGSDGAEAGTSDTAGSEGIPEAEDPTKVDVDAPVEADMDSDSESELDSDEDADDDDDDDDDDDATGLTEEEEQQRQKEKKERGTAGQEAEAGMEMSALVNYIQPVHFHSFEVAEKRSRSYECSSFVETQATNLLKEQPVEFVNFNKRQLSRIYPKGTRVDSSNYMPQVFWNAGCQLVALNFQSLDLAMQLNLGIFEYNGRSGYILKPDFMRRNDRRFDPFAESTVDGIVAGTVAVQVIAGQFLTDKKVGTYVEVDMYGLPADTVRKRFRTKTVPVNGINPLYNEEPFVFKKVVLPNLAVLRITVYDENSKLLGHRILPVEGLRPGYRHVCLRNEMNLPMNLAALFVHIKVGDYVPDAFADLAAALVNPIAYQSALEKHAQQLAVLTDDFDFDEEEKVEEQETKNARMKMEIQTTMQQKRVNSVKVKAEEMATSTLTRKGSHHAQLIKQESSTSGFSQGSSVSSASATTLSRLGSSTSGFDCGPIAESRLNGSKPSTATPGSPQRTALSTENGVSQQQPQKIDVLQTTKLKDPDILVPIALSDLRESKVYLKVLSKLEKELDSLRRKHEKARNSLIEMHELQEEKLLQSHVKQKTTIEKTQQKASKKASKRGNPEEMSAKHHEEMASLLREQQVKHQEMKQAHTEAYITLCKEQYKAELDMHLKFHPIQFDTLGTHLTSMQDAQMTQLDDIHDQEVADLKKKLDAQSREEMKILTKKHKDRNELSRLKREAQTKHINMAVQERQKLRDILEKRKSELTEKHEGIRKILDTEREERLAALQEEYDTKCRKIEEEHQSSKAVNGTSNQQPMARVNSQDRMTEME